MIQIWPFHLAPQELKNRSEHGGDEDWVILVPVVGTVFPDDDAENHNATRTRMFTSRDADAAMYDIIDRLSVCGDAQEAGSYCDPVTRVVYRVYITAHA